MIIAIANQTGGVGKSTTVQAIGSILHSQASFYSAIWHIELIDHNEAVLAQRLNGKSTKWNYRTLTRTKEKMIKQETTKTEKTKKRKL